MKLAVDSDLSFSFNQCIFFVRQKKKKTELTTVEIFRVSDRLQK